MAEILLSMSFQHKFQLPLSRRAQRDYLWALHAQAFPHPQQILCPQHLFYWRADEVAQLRYQNHQNTNRTRVMDTIKNIIYRAYRDERGKCRDALEWVNLRVDFPTAKNKVWHFWEYWPMGSNEFSKLILLQNFHYCIGIIGWFIALSCKFSLIKKPFVLFSKLKCGVFKVDEQFYDCIP